MARAPGAPPVIRVCRKEQRSKIRGLIDERHGDFRIPDNLDEIKSLGSGPCSSSCSVHLILATKLFTMSCIRAAKPLILCLLQSLHCTSYLATLYTHVHNVHVSPTRTLFVCHVSPRMYVYYSIYVYIYYPSVNFDMYVYIYMLYTL